jgi:hypothetical protein
MNDFTKDDYDQLVKFYKEKSLELEYQYLVLQLNNKKEVAKAAEDARQESYKIFSEQLGDQKATIETLGLKLEKVNAAYNVLYTKHNKKDKIKK